MTLGIDVYRIRSINIVAVPGSVSERLNLEDCSGNFSAMLIQKLVKIITIDRSAAFETEVC